MPRRLIRPGSDSDRQRAEERYKKLRLQYNKLWEEKYPEISERLKTGVVSPRGLESIEDLKRKLESLKTQFAKQWDLFDKAREEERGAQSTKK